MSTEATFSHSAMSESSKDALLLAQAQEIERLGLRLEALEALEDDAVYATPFADFDEEKKTLTILLPVGECSPHAKNWPLHSYIVTDQTMWIESWGCSCNMVDALFTHETNVEEDYKIWRIRAVRVFTYRTRDPADFVITKRSRLSSTPLQIELLGERRRIPPWAVWTKDVEERFCAELDKAWRAFGAEV